MLPQTDLGFTFKMDHSAGVAPNSSPQGGNVPPAVPAVSGTEAALISQEWQTPPVADDAQPVRLEMWPFPEGVFPRPIADFINAAADAMQVDPVFVALPALAACAGSVGNSRVLKLNATWTERAAFWTVIVAESGSRKTPAFKAAMAPVWEINRQLMNENAAQLLLWKNACGQQKKGEPSPVKPTEHRLVAQDISIEKLGVLLAENPRGLLVADNELSGWFESFTRYSSSSALSYWLNFYDGAPTIVDRVTRESLSLDCPLVSVCGTTQPAVLAKLLDSESWASGLAPRLIMACPPSDFRLYREPPAVIPGQAEYERILRFCATELAGTGLELKLSDPAKKAWEDDLNFRNKHAHFHSSGSRKAVLAKIASIPARWALVHHCLLEAERGSQAWETPVGKQSIAAGCFLAQWVEDESARVSSLLATASQEASDDFWLRALQGTPGVTAAEFSRNHNQRLPDSKAAENLLERLVGAGKIIKKETRTPANGRITARYSLQ